MTVSESIKEWLSGYDGADISEIATDFIEGDNGSFSIFKSPNTIEVEYIDGSKLVSEYYQFFARQSTIEENERIDNQQFLCDLEDWVSENDFEERYPTLPKGMTCTEVAVSNSETIISQEDDSAIYQITIMIQYLKERLRNE